MCEFVLAVCSGSFVLFCFFLGYMGLSCVIACIGRKQSPLYETNYSKIKQQNTNTVRWCRVSAYQPSQTKPCILKMHMHDHGF